MPALAAALAMSFVLLALPAQTGATPGSSHVAFGAGGTANFGVNPSFPDCSILFPPRDCVYGLQSGSFLSIDASDEGGGLGSAFFQRAALSGPAAQITLSCVVIEDVPQGHVLYASGTDAQATFWSIYLEVIGPQMPSYRVARISVGSGPCGTGGFSEGGGGWIDAGIFTIQPVPHTPFEADLSVAKTDSPDPVVVDQLLTYTVAVTNNGPNPATGVEMRDNLPADVTFQSATPSQGTCSQSSRTVSCQLGDLASGETATVEIQVTPERGGTITNAATASGNESDPDNANNTDLESTTVIIGYARPKSATPIAVRLVPDFNECTAPNATHGAPLESSSCSPPTQASSFLTLNAPDRPAPYNTGANSSGSLVMKVFCTDGAAPPCTTQAGDQQDVQLDATISGVRCVGVSGGCSAAGGTYAGKLLFTTTLRITDRLNGPSLEEPATVTDTPFQFGVQCSAGSCNISTTADSVIPGIAQEGKRAIWELSQIQVLDGGSDGNLVAAPSPGSGSCPPACAGNGGETVFLRQGLFAP